MVSVLFFEIMKLYMNSREHSQRLGYEISVMKLGYSENLVCVIEVPLKGEIINK
jgi:hypothetical protein